MILTPETFENMLKTFRASYGPNWRADINADSEAYLMFYQNFQEIIPEEMADVLVKVYRTRRARAPYSPYDIVEAYIERQLENAKSSEFVLDRLVTAIKEYEYSEVESSFASRDEYLFKNVIPMFPCSTGVEEFYIRHRKDIVSLALYSPDEFEQTRIYNALNKDYDRQLIIAERKSVLEMINYEALPGHTTHNLEA